MDEAMDTAENVDVIDEHESNDDGVGAQSSSMDTSPILDRRRIFRSLRLRRRVGVPTSREFNVLRGEASSSNPQPLDDTAESVSQQLQDISDPSPPPIEDTDLIMIHRPVSPNIPVNMDPDAAQEVVISTTEETNVQSMDIANEISNPPPETPPGENSSDSVTLEQEQDGDAAGETSQDDEDDAAETVTIHVPSSPAPPDVENLPLAQRIRSPDLIPPEKSPPLKKVKIEPEVQNKVDSAEDEEGNLCPICFDSWTNGGEHRLVALRCGHLFGKQCIEHWLQIHKANDRRCPQCKKKASPKDIRPLYASLIRAQDTSELEALKETLKKLQEEKDQLSRDLAYAKQLHQDALKVQQEQQLLLQELQSKGILSQSLHPAITTSKQVASIAAQIKISLTARMEVSREGGCRVLAFNEWKRVLVASQSQVTSLFPHFGIRFIDTEDFRPQQIFPMHTKPIRDLSFNPHRKDMLLTASLDKTAKMFCMTTNACVTTFNSEVPLWSCCWDGNNPHNLFVGSQNGITFQYDVRNTHTEVNRITTPGDGSPVISLAAVPGGSWLPCGGILSCRLNRLRIYERSSNSEFKENPLGVQGPFSALNYNHRSQHMLVSTKPTMQNPHAQHQLYEVGFAGNQPQTNIVHSFEGGTTQRLLSRPCQLEIDGDVKDTLVCAHQESEGHVAIWSVTSGQKIPAGPLICSEPIMDLCPINVSDRTFLASLSEKSLRVYQFST